MEEIDVSKCINYVDTFCNICTKETTGQFCSDNSNCYFKQLKRKEKECEELKEKVEYLQKFNIEQNEAYTFMNNLHWNNEDLEKVKLKEALQKIKEIASDEKILLFADERSHLKFNNILQKISEVVK